MGKEKDGGPAFPATSGNKYNGMSLRDYFAGCALTGLLADFQTNATSETYSARAYAVADAMLAERDK